LKVTQGSPSRQAMKVLDYVYEEAERTQAAILAEGVETERHHDTVCQLGAPLAQGWLYGKPTDAPVPGGEYQFRKRLGLDVVLEEVRTPFDVLDGRTISHASADIIHSLSHEIFSSGMHLMEPALALVLVAYPDLFNEQVRQGLSESAKRG